jgi:hypothetical protein
MVIGVLIVNYIVHVIFVILETIKLEYPAGKRNQEFFLNQIYF